MDRENPVFFLGDYIVLNNETTSEPASCSFSEQSGTEGYVEEESGDGENLILVNPQENRENLFVWDHKSTLLFLDEYEKRLNDFRNPKKKKKTIWENIAKELSSKGYIVDGNTLDRKMRNMKFTFSKIKDNNKKKKTGRGRITWEYYDRFCQIFIEDKTINTSNLRSSMSNECEVESTGEAEELKHSVNNNEVLHDTRFDNSFPETPKSSNTRDKQKKLDVYRQRLLCIEEERVRELKRIRLAIEENNHINQEKVSLLKQFLDKR